VKDDDAGTSAVGDVDVRANSRIARLDRLEFAHDSSRVLRLVYFGRWCTGLLTGSVMFEARLLGPGGS